MPGRFRQLSPQQVPSMPQRRRSSVSEMSVDERGNLIYSLTQSSVGLRALTAHQLALDSEATAASGSESPSR